ncbi:hypothetical protein ALC60_13154, partial [Trachymyrmex zeteki]
LKIKKMSASELCKMLYQRDLLTLYSNVNIVLRIFLCIMVSNCSGERSFSVLRRVNNYLRSTQSSDVNYALALLCIEAELNIKTDYNYIINEFAAQKSRKVTILKIKYM